MKRILVSSLLLVFAVSVRAQRPVTPEGPYRPFTSIVTERPQTPSTQRPQTGVVVDRPTTPSTVRPQTTVEVNRPVTVSAERPQTTVSAIYPQTTVEVLHPQTTVEVFHPQSPGEKSAPQTGQPRTFSPHAGGEDLASVPSSQATTSMSDFTPKPAKDFTKPESKAPEMGGGSLALGNDTAGESSKDSIASSHLRAGQQESLQADIKDNPNALAGLEKMLTDRTKVQQKKL